MSEPKTETKSRPYWHVDLKWVCGILTVLLLSASLSLFFLTRLTSEKVAIPLATEVVAALFSRGEDGIDDDEDIEKLRQQLSERSDSEEITIPLGGFEAKITKNELDTLSSREIRLRIFRQIVEPYYYQGADDVADSFANSPEQQRQIEQNAGLLALFNADTHRSLNIAFWLSLVLVSIPVIGLVRFSYRWGKLVSPAMVALIVSLLPSMVLTLFWVAINSTAPEGGVLLMQSDAAKEFVKAVAPVYWSLTALGTVLLIGAMIARLRQNHKIAS